MAFSFEQLRTGITYEDALAELKSFLDDQGIDTTSWKAGDPSQNNLQLQAYTYFQLVNKQVDYVNYTFNQYASGSGLTILADSFFDNQRISSQKTVGKVVLSGSGNFIFPQTWNAGEIQVTDGTYVFENVEQIVLSLGTNPVTSSFAAVESSADYNIATDSELSTVESIIGLTVTNPAQPSTTTWISTQGVDEEKDDVLRTRNSTKWSSLQVSEYTIDRVTALALSASSNVFYVSVDDTNPRGPYTVDCYLSRQLTTGSTTDVNLVQTKFDNAFWGNGQTDAITYHRISASLATQVEFSSSVDVYFRSGFALSTIKDQVESTINDWIASIPIGGTNYIPVASLANVARKNDLIALLEGIQGVQTVTLTPDTDWTFTKSQKLTAPSTYSSLITYTQLI